jgi:hypothetical protein
MGFMAEKSRLDSERLKDVKILLKSILRRLPVSC